ncbi:MAG: T9SS type A sorting domain-containing protein [Bacteroidota bacterium]
MKKVLITLLSLLVLLVTISNLQAQEKQEKHEVRMKIKKIVNGKETVIDSTFTLDKEADVNEILEKLGLDMDIDIKTLQEDDEDGKKKKVKTQTRIEKRIIQKGDEDEIEIEVEMDDEREGEENVFIFEGEDGAKKTMKIRIDTEGEDENVFIMKSADGKVIEMEEEQDIIIIKDGKVIDLKEEEGEKKVIRIEKIQKGEGEEEGEAKMIWKSDDGTVIELDGDKVKTKEMVFIRKSGEDGEAMDAEDIKKLLKEQGIEWEDDGEESRIIKKSFSTQVSVTPIEEEDKNVLEGLGFEEKELKNDLGASEMKINVESGGPIMVQIDTEEEGHLTALVRDTAGEVLSKTVLKESPNAYKIYLNLEDAGTYYLSFSQGGKSLTQKVIIKKD